MSLEHLGDRRALEGERGVTRGLARTQSVGRAFGTVEAHVDLRHEGDTLDLHVGHAGNTRHRIAHLAGQTPQFLEFVAENLDRDLGLHAGQNVVDTVRDGLAHAHPDPGQCGEAFADVGQDFRFRAVGGLQFKFDLRGIDLEHVLVAFGASRAARDGLGLGHATEQILGNAADAVAFLQRGARCGDDKGRNAALVEFRQKLAAERGQGGQRGEEEGAGGQIDFLRGGETEVDHSGFEGLDPADQPSVLPVLHALHARQKQGAKCGGHGQGHEQ